MLFILLVSLLLLLLLFIGQLSFEFCGIFGVPFSIVFYFHPPLRWTCVHTLILIMVVIPQVASLLLVFVSFWVILLFLGKARNKRLSLNLLPKQNIVLWHLLPKRLFGYVGYLPIWVFLFLIPLLCIVITRVLFRLLTTQFFMNGLSTLKSIVIWLVTTSSLAPLRCLLFLLPCSLQTFFTKSHPISRFRFLVSKLSMLLAAASWVWGGILI